ncbi:MAG: phosphatase PAP2 family protein [Verrucomicrobiota bacterium]
MKDFFQKGMPEGYVQKYPVTEENFPPSQGASIVSPRIGDSHGIKPPTLSGDEAMAAMCAETIRVRDQVNRGIWPAWFFVKYGARPDVPEPLRPHVLTAGRFDPAKAAKLVHMDKRDDLGRILLDYFGGMGKVKGNPDPVSGHIEFVQDARHADLLAEVTEALELCFEVKWFYGASRPEERIPLGPEWTAYDEGCPNHPRYPAGHSAAAAATADFVYSQLSEPTAKDLQLLANTCFHFAFYRTLAGVHDAEDNLAGLSFSDFMRVEFPAVAAMVAEE